MQIILVAHPLVRLPADATLPAGAIPLREEGAAICKVLSQILHDETRLGQDDGLALFLVGCWVLGIGRLGRWGEGDGDDGGFAEGMDLLEFGRGEHVGAAAEDLDVVGEVELLEQPGDTLGAGVVEPG